METKQTYGVQDWSAGPIYPAVIAVDVRYRNAEEDFRSYTVLLDGQEFPGYATYEDAAAAAPAILAKVRGRA